jgi:hypothetical protein
MKFQGGGALKRLYAAPVGVSAIALLVLLALITVARVDFEASRIRPHKGLKWLFVSQSDVNAFTADDASLPKRAKVTHNAWEAKHGSGNSSENLKNASVVEIEPNPNLELVAAVENATAAVDASGAESGEESEGAGESVESAVVEEADASSDWDPGWGAGEDTDALVDEEEEEEDAVPVEGSDTGPIEWKYDVCLLVKIGRRDGGDRPNVPFAELYRLFNAAKGAPNGSVPWKTLSERRLLVGTDFADILCLMVRDDLGPHVECTNYNRFGVKTNQVMIDIHRLGLGGCNARIEMVLLVGIFLVLAV